MKKLVVIFVLLLVFLNGCSIKEEKLSLNDLQITACNTADEANTCDTRLAELGIILKEDCCKALGKCCE